MHTLSDWFQPGERRSRHARETLRQAYQDVFRGTPSRQQQQAVLSDLLAFGNLFTVALPDEDLRLREGRRQVAYRLLRFLDLSDAERTATAVAAVTESLVSDGEGHI